MKRMYVWLFTAIVVLLFLGCATRDSRTETQTKTTISIDEDDFKSENGILKITNFSSVDVAIFAGKVERGTFIGAIKANASRYFDLNKISGLPRSGAFLFRATTYQQYGLKKAQITEEDVIYTGLVAYDLDKPDRKIEQDIFKNVDDQTQTFVYVENRSPYILELRIDSSDGERAAVLSPGQRNKKIWIKEQSDGMPYTFFPTYIYVDPNSGELNAFTDQVNLKGQRFEPQTSGMNTNLYTFKGPESIASFQYNVAFINFQNDTNELANFMTAEGNYRKNDRGTKSTSKGQSDIYQIDSDIGENGKLYSGLCVQFDSGLMQIDPTRFKPGHVYSLVVTKTNGIFQYDIEDVGLKSKVENARIDLFND